MTNPCRCDCYPSFHPAQARLVVVVVDGEMDSGREAFRLS